MLPIRMIALLSNAARHCVSAAAAIAKGDFRKADRHADDAYTDLKKVRAGLDDRLRTARDACTHDWQFAESYKTVGGSMNNRFTCTQCSEVQDVQVT